MNIVFQKNNVTLNQGNKDSSQVFELDSATNSFFVEIDNSGNGGMWNNKSETTVLDMSLHMTLDGTDNFPPLPLRSVTIGGRASCILAKDGVTQICKSTMGLVNMPPEVNGIPRRIKVELDITAIEPNEKTIQIKNYTVIEDVV